MDARLLLQRQGPAASPAAGAAQDARRPPVPPASDAERAFAPLSPNAIIVLALLVCGLVAAIAFRVVLQCVLRACHHGAGDAAAAPREEEEERAAPAAPGHWRHGGSSSKQPRRLTVTALVQALPWRPYSAGLELAGSARSECAICLAEFARGEPVRVLPRCGHGFHARCIDRWLAARPTCPTCRQPPFAEPATAVLLQPDSSGPAVVQLVRVVVVGDRLTSRVET